MKILIIGNGGREHALAWKAAKSAQVTQVFVAPGNAGTAQERKTKNVKIDPLAIQDLIDFAQDNDIELTIVGPEAPLVAGIVDAFEAAGLNIFGPSQAAAQLEGSKSFSKDFLKKYQIPTADYQTFTDSEKAKTYVQSKGTPIVIKADGLAAGKGVVIAQNESQAFEAIDKMLEAHQFGAASNTILIEEFLEGEEASFMVMADGKNVLAMASSQDHKALLNGDKGPNTGGMGAYSPAPVVTPSMHEKIMDQVILPTMQGLAKEGIAYKGFLYAGVMITKDLTPKVLEFNCRMGDPETQPILMRLQSDLVELCLAAVNGTLDETEIAWNPCAAVGIVMASGGYPETYSKGDVIYGLGKEEVPGVKVFHAGTALRENQCVTAGGRVLCVTALGPNVTTAQAKAYEQVKSIRWEKAYYREDIGYRAIAREINNQA